MPDHRQLILGVDIGGTKLAVGLVGAGGKQLALLREPTRPEQGPQVIVGRLADMCRRAVAEAQARLADVAVVGVGCGGPLDPRTGLVIGPVHLPGWINLPLTDMLATALGRPAFLDNDANAAALGEHRFGAGRGVANMVYLTISTGIGGGIVVENRLVVGENGNAGELGHMTVQYDGRPCGCGNRGCLEAYCSGTAIAARAREALAAGGHSSLARLEKITGENVVDAVRHGDPLALELWDQTMRILGAGLCNVIHAFNPRRIILGGGITRAGDLLFEPARRYALARTIPALAKVVDIVPADLGDAVGVLGAAAVGLDGLERQTHA